MKVVIAYNKPSNVDEWNALCKVNNNLLQSTFYDPVNAHYRQVPIYFECRIGQQLCAGVKIYTWEIGRFNKILGKISSSATQMGELILDTGLVAYALVQGKLIEALSSFLSEHGYVQYNSKGYYGDLRGLLQLGNSYKGTSFGVATINLKLSESELLENMHLNHYRSVKKAINSKCEFTKDVTFEDFYTLLQETYRIQNSSGPSKLFIKHLYKTLLKSGHVQLYGVKLDGQLLSVAMVTLFGNYGDYAFGGNITNKVGAGQLLHYSIMKDLKEMNFSTYSFGQVALEQDTANLKFSSGITTFKLRFGCFTVESGSYSYVLKPVKHQIYKTIIKIQNYGSKR